MSLNAMTDALGKVLNRANRGASLNQVAESVIFELSQQGYEVKESIDTGLSPMVQGAIELHTIFETLMSQGFTRDEAFALVEQILGAEITRWSGKGEGK